MCIDKSFFPGVITKNDINSLVQGAVQLYKDEKIWQESVELTDQLIIERFSFKANNPLFMNKLSEYHYLK